MNFCRLDLFDAPYVRVRVRLGDVGENYKMFEVNFWPSHFKPFWAHFSHQALQLPIKSIWSEIWAVSVRNSGIFRYLSYMAQK